MPCSCDGYGLSDAEQIRDLNKKVEHLEKMLCNAQSLIHKILKETVGVYKGCDTIEEPIRDHIDPELVKRADEHIALLVKHKRAEHQADRAKAEHARESYNNELSALERATFALKERHEAEVAHMERQKKDARERYAKACDLVGKPNPTDEELLG